MAEFGSDARFALLADASEINRRARLDRARRALEEWHVSRAPALSDPGLTYALADTGPPADQAHPEFEPLPPVVI